MINFEFFSEGKRINVDVLIIITLDIYMYITFFF